MTGSDSSAHSGRVTGREAATTNYNWRTWWQQTLQVLYTPVPSVLWRCWLGSMKGIRPVKTEWWGAGVVICLERGAGLHTARQMPLPLTVSCSVKSRLVLSIWCWLTRVVPDKGPLNGCVCVWLLCVMRHLAGQIVLRHRWHSAVLNIIISTAKLKMAYSCTWLKITTCVIFSHVTYQKRLCKCHPTMFYMRPYRCILCDFMVLASDSHSKWNKVLSFGSLVIHAEKIRLVVDSSCIESALFSSISSVLLHCWLCLRRAGIQPLEYEHLHFWSYDLVACIEMLIVVQSHR